jgi:Serine dehydrogenase proteinase
MPLSQRRGLLGQPCRQRQSSEILYVTGDRPGGAPCWPRCDRPLRSSSDVIGRSEIISLILYTNGGDALAAGNIVNLVRQFCDKLELIVPSKALSAGALIALGADCIVMTSHVRPDRLVRLICDPLASHMIGLLSVSVQIYLDVAKSELGIEDGGALASVLNKLAGQIHPRVCRGCGAAPNMSVCLLAPGSRSVSV